MAKAFLLLGLLCATTLSASTRRQVVTGKIVAYTRGAECVNGNTYWSMLIHVQRPKNVSVEFIRVDFSLRCAEPLPAWMTAEPSIQKFRLIRNKESDGVPQEFMSSEDMTTGIRKSPNPDMPIWRHLPGTEDEKLPFGRLVHAYLSVDLPLMPIF